jgi:sugar transferase (PEP-CTERM/EpsH1 system associated)
LTDRRRPLLYVVHRVPYPPDKGDRIRAYHILRHLSRHAEVHLACLADEPAAEATRSALERYCARVAVVPLGRRSRWLWALASATVGGSLSEGAFHSHALAALLRRWAEETTFHAALASASSVAPYLRVGRLRDVPAVVDLVDVDSQKWFDYAEASRAPRSWVYRLEGRRLRRREQALAEWARAVTLVSEHEVALLRPFVPQGIVHALGNGVDQEYFRPQECADGENGCVFVGALDYRPNVDGACWFAREVWPTIHARHPVARLRLVGRRPSPEVCRLGAIPGVEVIGQVPDVRPYVAAAAVAVVPLRIARGVQNKVLEAMAMAKPVLASPAALAGLGNGPDLPALRAAGVADWVSTLCNLLDDPARRQRLGLAGRQYVLRHRDWEHCLQGLVPLLSLAADSRPRHSKGMAPGLEVAAASADGRAQHDRTL